MHLPVYDNTHYRTHEKEALPHAEKKDMAESLRRLEQLLTVTPQRMRMIVDGFIDVLEKGLEEPGQMVVSGVELVVGSMGAAVCCDSDCARCQSC